MDRRVHVSSEAKVETTGAAAKASLNVATELLACGPKPRDLPVARLNTP